MTLREHSGATNIFAGLSTTSKIYHCLFNHQINWLPNCFRCLLYSSRNAVTDPLPLRDRGLPQCLRRNRHVHLRHSTCRLAHILLRLHSKRLICQPWCHLRCCTSASSMVCSFLRSSCLPTPPHVSRHAICSRCKTNGVPDSA